MSDTTMVLIALGSNLGDRAKNLNAACELLVASQAVKDFVVSNWLATPPIGGPENQGEFLNGAACFRTTMTPVDTFSLLKAVERRVGREHVEHWGPRQMDLDLLLFGDKVIASRTPAGLCVPHPRMAFRRFVLEPAAQVAPAMRHPVIGWTIAELLDHLQHAPPYIAIALTDRERASKLAAEVARATSAQRLTTSDATEASELLWDVRSREVMTNERDLQSAIRRPKLSVIDEPPSRDHEGPTLDVGKMTDGQAVIQIVAAIEAMRE